MPELSSLTEKKSVNPNVSQPDLDAKYQGLLDANPYLNTDYHESGWQRFLSALGFRTGYDKRMEDMQVQANEYNAQVAAMAFENEYNSPSAEAQRMRSAGLNPDLTGVDSAAESASMSEDNNPPASTEDDAQKVGQFANMLMSAFSMAVGFSKDLKTLKGLQLANENQEISNVTGIIGAAHNALIHHLPADMPSSDADWSVVNSDYSRALELSYKPMMTPRMYRRFSNEVSSMWRSLPREKFAYDNWVSRMKNRQEGFIMRNSKYYNENDEILNEIVGPLTDLLDRQIKAESSERALSAENAEAYQSAAQASGLPEAEAAGEIAEQKQQRQEFNLQRELRSTLSKIIHNLKVSADSGKRGSGLANSVLLTLSILSMMNIQSSKQSGFDRIRGNYQNSSRSIGF